MGETDEREKWEQRYQTPALIYGTDPSEYLVANASLLPSQGLALDIASGEGRNSVFLAGLGLEAVALDISELALRKCLELARQRSVNIDAVAGDATQFVIPPGAFDVIVNFNFLSRDLTPAIIRGLKPGGLIVFETLTVDYLRWKPDFNPSFLLERGELARMFRDLEVLHQRETTIEIVRAGGTTQRAVASLIARKRG